MQRFGLRMRMSLQNPRSQRNRGESTRPIESRKDHYDPELQRLKQKRRAKVHNL